MNALKTLLRHKALLLVFFFLVALLALPAPARAQALDVGQTIDNGIPVVYLNIDENQGSIDAMFDDPDHETYCYGSISIVVPDGFHYVGMEDVTCQSVENLAMSVRGRGNTTWSANTTKKPLKIKLDKGADILGLGKNKHWVLIANWNDSTYMKDRMTAWLGEQLGFEFTPTGVPVDLVITGKDFGSVYFGSYYLSENVRVDENRLNLEELKETDTDSYTITGGYLLQDAMQLREGSLDRFETTRDVDWGTNTPSFDVEQEVLFSTSNGEPDNVLGDAYENHVQQQYIQDYIQYVEDTIFEGGTAYRDVMDIESAAKYWMVEEVCMNGDAFNTGSCYIYKHRGDNRIYWGPLWDFDYGWGWGFSYNQLEVGHTWLKPLFYDKTAGGFNERVHSLWPEMRALLVQLIEDGGILDQYYAETKRSADADYAVYYEGSETTFEDKVATLKTWIANRIAWLDEYFDDKVDDLVHKVTFVVDGEEYAFDFMAAGDYLYGNEDHPEKEGYFFKGWAREDGTFITGETGINKDTVLTAVYLSDDEVTHATDIAFGNNSPVTLYRSYMRTYMIQYEVIPADADDKEVTWTSSDESMATIRQDGTVTFNGPGTFTFTATLRNGVSKDFTLTVMSNPLPAPESITPDTDVFNMAVGDQLAFSFTANPSPAFVSFFEFTSDEESVVTVDDLGVLTAVGPGQTTVRVTAYSYDEDYNDLVFETYATVIVGDEGETEEIVYTVTDGADSTWTKGSSEGVTIAVKRSVDDETCIDHFAGVSIDGQALVRDADYTAVAGSTVVTLPAATLEALDEGEHAVNLAFDDGDAETTLTILADEEGDAPAPGGDTPAPGGNTNPQPDNRQSSDNRGTPGTGDPTLQVLPALMAAGLTCLAVSTAARKRYE